MKMAAGRVFWTEDECNLLISTIDEKNILKLIDGKKYRRKDIFKIVKSEFERRGINDKNEYQIENKWKNLKKLYVAAKKINERSGEGKASCEYYDMLDRVLSTRPSSSCIPNYIDTSEANAPGMESCQESIPLEDNTISDGNEENRPSNEESVPGSSRTRKRKANRTADVANEFNKIFENLQEKFLDKQKELINYELGLYRKEEESSMNRFYEETKKILDDSNTSFLNDLKTILSSEGQRNNGNNSHCSCDTTSNVERELGAFLQFKD